LGLRASGFDGFPNPDITVGGFLLNGTCGLRAFAVPSTVVTPFEPAMLLIQPRSSQTGCFKPLIWLVL
jgi:hypothetical protein